MSDFLYSGVYLSIRVYPAIWQLRALLHRGLWWPPFASFSIGPFQIEVGLASTAVGLATYKKRQGEK